MAEVFLAATPPPVVRRVAVKRIKPLHAAEKGFLEMFEDEARVAACFDHPNVVRVLDFEPGPPPYLVMEHLDGPDLRHLFWEAATKQQWMPVHIAAAIVADAARGLHYAHTWKDPEGQHLQVIHRDMSPQNIMLTAAGGVKVLDFGIAKAAGRNTKTQAGIIKGKYAYMAPEQVRGGTLTPRTDVFALGIILYEAITYKNPFRRDRDEMTLIAVSDEAPEVPKSLRADLPDDLAEIILKALEKDPEKRFESAQDFSEALDASVASRRKPVRQEHIADFLSGIEALPLPGEAEAPVSEADHEVSEADVKAASSVFSVAEIQKAVAEAEAEKAASSAAASITSESTSEDAPPEDAPPKDARAEALPEADGDTGATGTTQGADPVGEKEAPVDAKEAPAEATADPLLDASTRIQEKIDLPTPAAAAAPEAKSEDPLLDKATRLQSAATMPTESPDDGDYAVDGPMRPLTMPATPRATIPPGHKPGPKKVPMPERKDSLRGSFPQAVPPDWKLPVIIVIVLALVGGLVGAGLALLAG